VHGAMFQATRVNLAPGVLTDHLVAVVDDIKDFFGHGS
jgi:hypothetical protein